MTSRPSSGTGEGFSRPSPFNNAGGRGGMRGGGSYNSARGGPFGGRGGGRTNSPPRAPMRSGGNFFSNANDFAPPPPPENEAASAAPPVNIVPSAVNDHTHVIEGPNGGRILCVADVRGNLSSLNQLAAEANAKAIIHTGDFGFYESSSLSRISDRTLKHLVQYSTLVSADQRAKLLASDPQRGLANAAVATPSTLRTQVSNFPTPLLSEFPLFLDGQRKLNVPVFTVWGACEDVAILEKFRTGEYAVPNLHILDEATTSAIDVGGIKLRLFGLGGAVVLHKLFDNGLGNATIAGGQGTMWTTILQIGELIDTAQKVYDPTETRVLVTHASPGREGLLAQLALSLKADLTISGGLHFRYTVSYNEFSVQHDAENFRNKLVSAKTNFNDVWETVKTQVESVIDANQRILLSNALAVANRLPPVPKQGGVVTEEPAWKNMWNWNLPDAAYGSLVLDIKDGKISSETRSQGFNFAFRRNKDGPAPASTPVAAPPAAEAVAALPSPAAAPAALSGLVANRALAPRPTPQAPTAPRAFWDSPKSSPASKAIEPQATAVNGEKSQNGTAPASAASATGSPKDPRPLMKDRKNGSITDGSRSDADALASGAESARSVRDSKANKPEPRQQQQQFTIYVSGLGDVLPIQESDVKTFFGDAAGGITNIKIITTFRFGATQGQNSGASGGEQTESESQAASKEDKRERVKVQRPFTYVSFVDEAAMQAGLAKKGGTLKTEKGECVPQLEAAMSPEEKEKSRAGKFGGKFRSEGNAVSGNERSGDEGGPKGFSKRGGKSRGGQKNRRGGAPGTGAGGPSTAEGQ